MPFLTVALPHDWHHCFSTENFGPIGLLDRILKTDRMYKNWLAVVDAEFGRGSLKIVKATEILNVFDDECDGAVLNNADGTYGDHD